MKFKKILLLILFIFLFNKISYSNDFTIKDLISLNTPWGLSFIDENKIIITEKNGSFKIYNINENKIYPIKHNLKISNIGQGGLLDVLYKNEIVYVSYSEKLKNNKSSTSIAIATYNNNFLEFKNIFRAEPAIQSGFHFGSRMVLKDDFLYASIGERGKGDIAQDPSKHPGSIIRIHKDGTIPKDNPKFLEKKKWAKEIYQIGVRNPQGMALSPFDSNIYISNHGAKGGDWFGEVTSGSNYGWPVLGWGGTNYSGSKIGPKWLEGFKKPIYYWVPSIATSAIIIYKGQEFKEWNGSALITSLKDQTLRKLEFTDLKNIKEDIIFSDLIGRIRDIDVHPTNGKIFLLSSNKLWIMQK